MNEIDEKQKRKEFLEYLYNKYHSKKKRKFKTKIEKDVKKGCSN